MEERLCYTHKKDKTGGVPSSFLAGWRREILGGYLKEVNIKSDLPTVSDAIKRVTYNIRNGRDWGCAAIKIIHGYGSTGKGGKIRTETRRYLQDQKRKGLIREFIPGEAFSIFDEATRKAFDLCDDLRKDHDLERHNNGVTIVIL
jgi:hypothetical protein